MPVYQWKTYLIYLQNLSTKQEVSYHFKILILFLMLAAVILNFDPELYDLVLGNPNHELV